MQYFNDYREFSSEESTNEGIMDFLKAASGAVKNFVNGISAPFKNFKADFQKGLDAEQAKANMIKKLDDSLAQAIKNINTVKEQSEIDTLVDSFQKVIDNMIADFDKSIPAVKESNSINEGKIQDALINGRVFLGLMKDEITKFTKEFKDKFAKAKDLAAAKTIAIETLKKMVNEAKKKISDQKIVDQATAKYKQEQNIESKAPAAVPGQVVLDWGDVEATLQASKEKPGFYQIIACNSKTLQFKEGQKLFVKIPDMIKVGDKVMMSELERDGKPDPLKQYETGAIQTITNDGKDVKELKSEGQAEDVTKKAQEVMGTLKGQDEKMGKVVKFAQFIQDDANKDKVEQIEKIMSESFFQTNFGTFIRG